MSRTLRDVARWGSALYRRFLPLKLTDDEQFAVWSNNVEAIQNYITEVFRHRKIFRDTTRMLQTHRTLANDSDAGYWYAWLRNLYAHYITMSIRRELDRGATGPNLYRLLQGIRKRPEVISRVRHTRLYSRPGRSQKEAERLAGEDFDGLCGKGRPFIDHKSVKNDLDALDKTAKEVIQYANKIVAHRTDDEVDATMEQANAALERIEEILQKYYALLRGQGLLYAEPAILTPWERAFRVPWIER